MLNKKHIICEDHEVPIVIPKRLMIFAPHPDDELISCGGTILKYNALGSEISIIIATPGLGGYAKQEEKHNIATTREEELEDVSEILNADVIELGYQDLQINRDKVSKITNLIRDLRPHVVMLPHFSDFHRVHRNLSLIVRESIYHCATGKAYGGHSRSWTPLGVYYYESPSCKFQYIEGSVFVIVDIEDYWKEKKEIFSRIYKSQKEVLKRVIDWAEDTAVLRGNEINTKFGEAFIPETTYTPLKILLG
ncbi:MAG: Bacillithiol biosynthesis cysteine-adding enzyme BshC [Promethearchaeota archaeon]|nr:MAG: Bacillithiol biosynthesis cysteine-adding enzyme BshC [Candidatus Lokiarchaeota archaeon]